MWYSERSSNGQDPADEKPLLSGEERAVLDANVSASLEERPTPWSLYILPFSALTLIYTGVSCLPPPYSLSSSTSSLLSVSVTNQITSEGASVNLGVWGWCESLGSGEHCIAGREIIGYGWEDVFGRLPSLGMMAVLKQMTSVCRGPTFMKLMGPLTLSAFIADMMTFYFAVCALFAQRQMAYHARRSSLSQALQNRSCYHTLLSLALCSAVVSSVLFWTAFGVAMSLLDKIGMVFNLHERDSNLRDASVLPQVSLGQGGWFLMVCAVTSTLPLVTFGLHFALDALDDQTGEIILQKGDEPLESPREACQSERSST